MNFNKKITWQFLVLIFLYSCDIDFVKNIDVDLGSGPEELVVNSIIEPNKPFTVQLSLTQSVLNDKYPSFLHNAIMLIQSNGQTIDTLKHKFGNYSTDLFLEPYNSYQLVTQVPGFETAEATIEFPPKAYISDVTSNEITVQENGGYSYKSLAINFNLHDTPGKSYFIMMIKNKETDQFEYWKSRDAVFVQSGGGDISGDNTIDEISVYDYIWFNDELFTNSQREITVNIPIYFSDFETFSAEYNIIIYSIHEDYYNFLRRFELQENSRTNPFAEPVEVFGNVKNALGIVTGIQSMIYTVRYTNEVN
jgi:hypothetical protein